MTTRERWRRWHERRPWHRRLTKILLFALTLAIVFYPKFWLLPRWLGRLGDMNSVLDPRDPRLAPLETAVRARLTAASLPTDSSAPSNAVLAAAQSVVYETIPYAWDWDTWGVVDYLPTVAEVFERGQEDCDGLAVVAASLLRRMGYDARLVSDLVHTWVATPVGETMSPGLGEQTLVGGKEGTATRVSLAAMQNLGRGTAYGIAYFPLPREVIIAAALCLLSLHPRLSLWRGLAGCGLLFVALFALRHTGGTCTPEAGRVLLLWACAGVGFGGWLLLLVRGAARHSHAAPPGSPPASDAPRG